MDFILAINILINGHIKHITCLVLDGLYLFKVAPDLCGTITLCSIKVRVILIFSTSIGFHKKPSPCLSTHLYNQVYFDRRDQFNPPMGLSDTG